MTLPASFTDEVVTSVAAPTALAFTPDGRMLIATQPGRLRVFSGGTLLPTPALDLSTVVCTESERGLLGVAVDPQFAANRFIYVYYTFKRADPCSGTNAVNRVSRFVLADANTVDPATETVLIDNIPSPAGNHNGGDLQFGKDGNLYVSVGDGGCDYAGARLRRRQRRRARRERAPRQGAAHHADGAIPASNPFQGLGTGRCNLTGARPRRAARRRSRGACATRSGSRSIPTPPARASTSTTSARACGRRSTTASAGADYGWNVREGHCVNGSATNCPAAAGRHDRPDPRLRPRLDGLHARSPAAPSCPTAVARGLRRGVPVRRLRLRADLRPHARPAPARSSPTSSAPAARCTSPSARTAATQALYYTSYLGGGAVHRIAYTAPATPPAPPAGRAGRRATPPPAGAPTDAGNAPPQPVIASPSATRRFAVGQTIALRGSAVDREDGTLPPSRLSWTGRAPPRIAHPSRGSGR